MALVRDETIRSRKLLRDLQEEHGVKDVGQKFRRGFVLRSFNRWRLPSEGV